MDKPDSLTLDGPSEDLKNTGVMVNADGDFVIAKPDKAAWELYQEKAKASATAAAEAAAAEAGKELQARGLECPIDKRMFLEPTKTPCCQRTYCNDCITNALIESDFVCPGCASEGVLLDNLAVDDQAVAKIKAYETEKAESKKEKEKHAADESRAANEEPNTAGPTTVRQKSASPPGETTPAPSKKRALEADTPDAEPGSSESAKKQKADHKEPSTEPSESQGKDATPASMPQPQMFDPGYMQSQGMPAMPFSNAGFPNGMNFMNPMGMPPGNGFPMDQMWNPMNMMNFNPLQNGMYGGFNGSMSNGYGAPNMYNGGNMPMFPMGPMAGSMQPNPGFDQGAGMGHFSNQQRTAFSTPFAKEEDTPYFRQPVNPQRQQARHRRVRPSDYREL